MGTVGATYVWAAWTMGRDRYGYLCIRRAMLDCDPILGRMNVRDGHVVHPVGYFGG